MKSPLVLVRNDPRTPLEKALGVNPDLCKERLMQPLEKQKEVAKATLLKHGMKVIELPTGRWHVIPEYPPQATDEDKARIDAACEDWMRRVHNLKGKAPV